MVKSPPKQNAIILSPPLHHEDNDEPKDLEDAPIDPKVAASPPS
jgi:hypothetical protein